MSYSGAQTAKTSRENLGKALAALQEDPNIPPDVLAIAQNVAQAMASLFEAERAPTEPDGKAAVKRALGVVGQTLALLQDVRATHPGIQVATASIASTMSALYPLTTVPSMRPPPPAQPPQGMGGAPMMGQPAPSYAAPSYAAPSYAAPNPAQPSYAQPPMPAQPQYAPGVQPASSFNTTPQQPAPQQAYQPPQQAYQPPPQQPAFQPPAAAPAQPASTGGYRGGGQRTDVEANIGATTDSNFFIGFSGKIEEGGVFLATYNIQPRGTPMRVLVTLPGNFQHHVNGTVRFVRDPMDLNAESEPGMGIQFEGLDPEAQKLIMRFIAKRAPMFYDE